jgi:uncharacterized membrane protein
MDDATVAIIVGVFVILAIVLGISLCVWKPNILQSMKAKLVERWNEWTDEWKKYVSECDQSLRGTVVC